MRPLKMPEYIDKIRVILELFETQFPNIETIVNILIECHRDNRQVFIVGNGGSAATASHMANDFQKTVFGERPGRFRVFCLNDNTPLITAIANDISYNSIFSRQLNSLANKNDILIVISGSGNSKNIINALIMAKLIEMKTIGFLGFDGGIVKHHLDIDITTHCSYYGPIEDSHMILAHLITEQLKIAFNPK